MKLGLRKLCDVYGEPTNPDRAEIVKRLLRAGITFDAQKITHRDKRWKKPMTVGIRLYVSSVDVRRAQALLPLTLRGFKPVGESANHGSSAAPRGR